MCNSLHLFFFTSFTQVKHCTRSWMMKEGTNTPVLHFLHFLSFFCLGPMSDLEALWEKGLVYLNTQLTPKSFELDCFWTSPEWCCYWKMAPNILAFWAIVKDSGTVTISQKKEFRAAFWHRQNVTKYSVKNNVLLFCCNNSQLLKEELVCKLQTGFSVGKTFHLYYLCLVQHSTSYDS